MMILYAREYMMLHVRKYMVLALVYLTVIIPFVSQETIFVE